MTAIDLTPYTDDFIKTATAVFSVVVPAVSAYLIRHLHLQKDTVAASLIDQMVTNAGRLALHEVKSLGQDYPTVEVKNAAVGNAVNSILAVTSKQAKTLGITPETLGRMVGGELEKLLGMSSPTVVVHNVKPSTTGDKDDKPS